MKCFRLIGWKEGDGYRVFALAGIPDPGATTPSCAGVPGYKEIDFGSVHVRSGQDVVFEKMKELGMTPWVIRARTQKGAGVTGITERELVSAAEREGAAFARDTRSPSLPNRHFADFAASGADRKCAAARGMGPVRSGQFVIGGGLSGPRNPKTGEMKVWWAPMHHAASMDLHVRARRVGGDATEYRSSKVAWPVSGPGGSVPVADRSYFFPSGISFGASGTWVVVATQGSDWGCFVLTVP